jgi:hypothetical protein
MKKLNKILDIYLMTSISKEMESSKKRQTQTKGRVVFTKRGREKSQTKMTREHLSNISIKKDNFKKDLGSFLNKILKSTSFSTTWA